LKDRDVNCNVERRETVIGKKWREQMEIWYWGWISTERNYPPFSFKAILGLLYHALSGGIVTLHNGYNEWRDKRVYFFKYCSVILRLKDNVSSVSRQSG
jgi:hypothetical protein